MLISSRKSKGNTCWLTQIWLKIRSIRSKRPLGSTIMCKFMHINQLISETFISVSLNQINICRTIFKSRSGSCFSRIHFTMFCKTCPNQCHTKIPLFWLHQNAAALAAKPLIEITKIHFNFRTFAAIKISIRWTFENIVGWTFIFYFSAIS